MKEYEGKETGLALTAKINKDNVSLKIPNEKDGWEFIALKSLEVMILICLQKCHNVFYSWRKKPWITMSLKEKSHTLLLL